MKWAEIWTDLLLSWNPERTITQTVGQTNCIVLCVALDMGPLVPSPPTLVRVIRLSS